MAAKKVKVIYLDGREEVVKVPARAQLMTEEHCNGFTRERAILATFYLAWATLNVRGMELLDFETWIDKIDDVEDVDDETPGPTLPAQSTDTSSD